MKKTLFILTVSLLILTSCNYKLFVSERNVVKRERGFLVFRGEYGVVFFPTSDTADTDFLSDKKKKEGYKVEFDTGWLDSLSVDYSYIATFKGSKLSILPVEITYYLGDSWQKKDEQYFIEYTWQNESFVLRFKQHDWRQILMISVVREKDKNRLKELDTGSSPLHY